MIRVRTPVTMQNSSRSGERTRISVNGRVAASAGTSAAIVSARRALGMELASLRRAAGYTQMRFAPLTGYGRSTLANVETGRQNVPRAFWRRCATALGAGILLDGFDQIEAMVHAGRQDAAASAQAERDARVSALAHHRTAPLDAQPDHMPPDDQSDALHIWLGTEDGITRHVTIPRRTAVAPGGTSVFRVLLTLSEEFPAPGEQDVSGLSAWAVGGVRHHDADD